ncbi:MAG: plasmid mobilization protein [Thiobacillaceae bacterium]
MGSRTRIEFRCSEIERRAISGKASVAELTVSEFVRRVALGRKILPVTDRVMVGELRRLGAMLKHRYPKNANWTLEEKRRYWAGLERLIALAKSIENRTKGMT